MFRQIGERWVGSPCHKSYHGLGRRSKDLPLALLANCDNLFTPSLCHLLWQRATTDRWAPTGSGLSELSTALLGAEDPLSQQRVHHALTLHNLAIPVSQDVHLVT